MADYINLNEEQEIMLEKINKWKASSIPAALVKAFNKNELNMLRQCDAIKEENDVFLSINPSTLETFSDLLKGTNDDTPLMEKLVKDFLPPDMQEKFFNILKRQK